VTYGDADLVAALNGLDACLAKALIRTASTNGDPCITAIGSRISKPSFA
jgi:hypothetical protein